MSRRYTLHYRPEPDFIIGVDSRDKS